MYINAATRALGRAESTIRHDAAAAKLFRGYRHKRGLTDQMIPGEVEGDAVSIQTSNSPEQQDGRRSDDYRHGRRSDGEIAA